MREREDQENLRRSRAMVDAVRPVRYWRERPTVDHLAERVELLEQRTADLRRQLAEVGQRVTEQRLAP